MKIGSTGYTGHLSLIGTYLRLTGHDPATSSARAGYAAERARITASELINWPPARNAPCWCGTVWVPNSSSTAVTSSFTRRWLSCVIVDRGGVTACGCRIGHP